MARRHTGASQLSHGFKISTKNPFGNGEQTPPSDEEEEKPGDLGALPAASAEQPRLQGRSWPLRWAEADPAGFIRAPWWKQLLGRLRKLGKP